MTVRKWFASAVGALVVAGLAVASAAASQPVVVEKNVTFTRVFSELTDCQAYGYSFTFTARYTIRRSDTLYYDRDGNLVREVRQVHFVGTDTNDENGTSLRDTGERHIVLDFVNDTFSESGVLRHVTVPGSGIVLHESGRLILSLSDDSVIFMAGPHQLFSGDQAEFCAALAAA
jgi:hypothetical protein